MALFNFLNLVLLTITLGIEMGLHSNGEKRRRLDMDAERGVIISKALGIEWDA